MLQSYMLRLGDGTVLAVDHDGLSIWLIDRKAMVQPVGSDHWKPLKQFLAQERSAARRAARRQPKRPSTARDALPLVYPKPRKEPASRRPGAKVPSEQPPGSRAGDKEPIPVRADGLPLIPPPPKPRDDPGRAARRPAPAPPATVVRPSLPKTPPVPVLAREPAGPRGGERKPTADSELPRISVTPHLIPSKPPIVIPSKPSLVPPPPARSPSPTLSPKPRDDRDKVVRRPAHSAPRAPAEPPAQPMVVQPSAEPATLSKESAPPSLPSDEDVGWMALPEPLNNPVHDGPLVLPATLCRDPLESSSAGARPSPLQEALLRALSRALAACESLLTRWINSLARRDWQATRRRLMSQAASAYGALLAAWKSLAHGNRTLPSLSPGEPAPSRGVDAERSAPLEPRPSVGVPLGAGVLVAKGTDSLAVYSPRRSTDDGLPILELEPLDDEEGADAFFGSHSPRSTDDLPEIILEPLDDERPTEAAASRPKGPAPREALKPRLPMRGLPVRRLAEPPRPVETRGTKRLVVMSGLVAFGLFAVLTSKTWVPKAKLFGRGVVRQNDRLDQSSDAAERQRQAQQEASERLPHLAPETIRLVLAKSATGVLDPPAVFQLACDAADRGSWVLTPEEVLELRALRRELLDALLPWEAERVLEYDDARARRTTFPFENRAALDLFARGTSALPSRSRARLQVLFGKAIAAQLRAEGAPRP